MGFVVSDCALLTGSIRSSIPLPGHSIVFLPSCHSRPSPPTSAIFRSAKRSWKRSQVLSSGTWWTVTKLQPTTISQRRGPVRSLAGRASKNGDARPRSTELRSPCGHGRFEETIRVGCDWDLPALTGSVRARRYLSSMTGCIPNTIPAWVKTRGGIAQPQPPRAREIGAWALGHFLAGHTLFIASWICPL